MDAISGVSGAGSQYQAQLQKAEEKQKEGPDIYEMMRDAKEKAEAAREKFQSLKSKPRYGDAPIEAHARLARAKRPSEVNAAAGYARRQITRLKAAKRQDPDNAKRIQAAINQLQKAVNRAGKKCRELEKEKVAEARQKRLAEEHRSREARRQKQELRRKQAARMLRESGYIREAEIDNRMQSHISSTQMELREQAQKLAETFQPSPEAAAAGYAGTAAPATETGTELNLEA